MSTEEPETIGEVAENLRRDREEPTLQQKIQRAAHARRVMADQGMGQSPADLHDIVASTPIGSPFRSRLTEAERSRIERGSKPGPISRMIGLTLGTIIGGGSVVVSFILMIKVVVWAWNL